jgi:hypothetical protein
MAYTRPHDMRMFIRIQSAGKSAVGEKQGKVVEQSGQRRGFTVEVCDFWSTSVDKIVKMTTYGILRPE